jgi:hypothetical protein
MSDIYSRVFSEYGLAVLTLALGNVGQGLAIRALYKRNVQLSDRLSRVGENLAAALGRKRSQSEHPPPSY